jgi:hypothetical protein
MKRLSIFGCAALLCFVTVGAFQSGSRTSKPEVLSGDVSQATNAAYRDGLYLGTRAVRQGDAYHAPIGRWATEADRSAFAAGYQRGYTSFAVDRALNRPNVMVNE